METLIEEQIKQLEQQRDEELKNTPCEIISTTTSKGKGIGNLRTINRTTHTQIKAKYNKMISCLKKYGVTNPGKLEEFQKHRVKVFKENVDKNKMSESAKKRFSNIEEREKYSKILTERWKDEKLREYQKQRISEEMAKIKQSHIKAWAMMDDQTKKDRSNKISVKLKNNDERNSKISKTLKDKYNDAEFAAHMANLTKNYNKISKLNKQYQEYFEKETGVKFELEKDGFDLKYNNLVLEIDPSFSHNINYSFAYATGKSSINNPIHKNYHYYKTLRAQKLGYKCIHIFDWDDLEKIANLVKEKEILYARNLSVKEVPKIEARDFLNNYHLQGDCRNKEIMVGLYKDGELVELMVFGKARYNNKYQYELLRLCSHKDYKIVGGAERLFKHFVKIHKPTSIISYCDISKFEGNVYKKLGFKLERTNSPSCHWYNEKTGRHITQSLLTQKGFSKLHKDNNYQVAQKGESNTDLMLRAHYVQVYDCGQEVYTWEENESK